MSCTAHVFFYEWTSYTSKFDVTETSVMLRIKLFPALGTLSTASTVAAEVNVVSGKLKIGLELVAVFVVYLIKYFVLVTNSDDEFCNSNEFCRTWNPPTQQLPVYIATVLLLKCHLREIEF